VLAFAQQPWIGVAIGISSIIENHHTTNSTCAILNMSVSMGKYVFFNKPEEENGFLSMRYDASITVDGVIYCSAWSLGAKITRDTVLADDYGNRVVNVNCLKAEIDFVTARFPLIKDHINWIDPITIVMYSACIRKFDQNPALLIKLMRTGSNEIVFSNEDSIGNGIGFTADDAIANCNKWGNNSLGKILMRLRESYMGEMTK
jgi:predicted NAD-dependent protein-ADP-ribosyltransferase YbiA (DUF1768 family)